MMDSIRRLFAKDDAEEAEAKRRREHGPMQYEPVAASAVRKQSDRLRSADRDDAAVSTRQPLIVSSLFKLAHIFDVTSAVVVTALVAVPVAVRRRARLVLLLVVVRSASWCC
jgi:hypothetical protein